MVTKWRHISGAVLCAFDDHSRSFAGVISALSQHIGNVGGGDLWSGGRGTISEVTREGTAIWVIWGTGGSRFVVESSVDPWMRPRV